MDHAERWPRLDLASWAGTYATVHRWTQMLGKTRLGLAPFQNHWWHSALYPTPHGLTTSAMPYRGGMIELELDFRDDVLRARSSRGETREMELRAEPVRATWVRYRALLDALGCDVDVYTMPMELPGARRFEHDDEHASYDGDAVRRCHQALLRAHEAFQTWRGEFIGKCSPSHFWWGAYDLACTRFSGRTAPRHPGSVPNMPDYVAVEAYSHECVSVGWWPGTIGGPVQEAAFYAYAYPEPAGCRTAPIEPAAGHYHDTLREWILPYEAVRTSATPERDVASFLNSCYTTAAELGGWDRASLERRAG